MTTEVARVRGCTGTSDLACAADQTIECHDLGQQACLRAEANFGKESPGGKVKSVCETMDQFKIEFEDGSSATWQLADPGSSVAVRDRNNGVEYLG